jgi:hypothetical protein
MPAEKRAGGLCLRHVTWGRVCYITREPHTQPPAILPRSLIVCIDVTGKANIVVYIPSTAEKYTWVSPGTFSGERERNLPCKLSLSCVRISPDGPLHSEQKNILTQEVLETTDRLLSFDTTRAVWKTTPPTNLRCREPFLSNNSELHRQTHRLSFDTTRIA